MSTNAPAKREKPRTFTEEVGANKRLWVAWDAQKAPAPAYPPFCPCCLEKPEPGAHIRVENKAKTLRYDFPSCATCMRHTDFSGRATDLMGTAVFALAAISIFGWLFMKGGFAGLLEPFRSPIRGALFAAVGMALMIAWTFALRWLVIWPLEKALKLNKASCRWYERAVKWGAFNKASQSGLGFENLQYARRFTKANGID